MGPYEIGLTSEPSGSWSLSGGREQPEVRLLRILFHGLDYRLVWLESILDVYGRFANGTIDSLGFLDVYGFVTSHGTGKDVLSTINFRPVFYMHMQEALNITHKLSSTGFCVSAVAALYCLRVLRRWLSGHSLLGRHVSNSLLLALFTLAIVVRSLVKSTLLQNSLVWQTLPANSVAEILALLNDQGYVLLMPNDAPEVIGVLEAQAQLVLKRTDVSLSTLLFDSPQKLMASFVADPSHVVFSWITCSPSHCFDIVKLSEGRFGWIYGQSYSSSLAVQDTLPFSLVQDRLLRAAEVGLMDELAASPIRMDRSAAWKPLTIESVLPFGALTLALYAGWTAIFVMKYWASRQLWA